jgi:hypothetical protein
MTIPAEGEIKRLHMEVKTAEEWFDLCQPVGIGCDRVNAVILEICKERDEAIAKLEAEIKDWEDRDFDAYEMKERF